MDEEGGILLGIITIFLVIIILLEQEDLRLHGIDFRCVIKDRYVKSVVLIL